MHKETLQIIEELEHHLSQLTIPLETLQNLQRELSQLRTSLEPFGKTKTITINPDPLLKISLLDDLLYYTVKDCETQLQKIFVLLESLMQMMTS